MHGGKDNCMKLMLYGLSLIMASVAGSLMNLYGYGEFGTLFEVLTPILVIAGIIICTVSIFRKDNK